VSGARSDQSNVTLEGVDVNDPQWGYAYNSVLRLTPESLQEFRVSTANCNADMGPIHTDSLITRQAPRHHQRTK
jgi:hypothetical protein